MISNIVTDQLNEILEYNLRESNIPAEVKSGDYDNIVNNSLDFKNDDLIIIFWEIGNLVNGFHYNIHLLNDKQFIEFKKKTEYEIDMVLDNLKSAKSIIFNKFSSLIFNHKYLEPSRMEDLSIHLNDYVSRKKCKNMISFDIDKVIALNGIKNSFNERFYYSSKMLYTVSFFIEYANHISFFIKGINGKAKKVLIFDCDNTLWKGILGETGYDNIEMSSSTSDGQIFEEVQSLALKLSLKGVLLGLCTKNNYSDIKSVLNNHPDMKIREKNLVVIRSNWQDKVTNLIEISDELNVGLDSIVFIDDSDFEVSLVKNKLPEISVFQVPKKVI